MVWLHQWDPLGLLAAAQLVHYRLTDVFLAKDIGSSVGTPMQGRLSTDGPGSGFEPVAPAGATHPHGMRDRSSPSSPDLGTGVSVSLGIQAPSQVR